MRTGAVRPRELLTLGLILCGWFVVRWPFRAALLVRDEGEYAHLGQQILDGAIPYLEIYNQKTPFTFYLMAAVQALFGEGLVALRLATTVYGMATAVLVYFLARRLASAGAAPWAVLGLGVLTFSHAGVLYQASTEFFMLGWIAAGLLFVFGRGEKPPLWRLIAAGVCAGLAYQTKQSAMAFVLFLLLERLLRGVSRNALRGALAIAAGFVLVQAGVLLYFAAAGGLGAYVECTWTNNVQYVGARQTGLGGFATLLRSVATSVLGRDTALWGLGAAGLMWLGLRSNSVGARRLWLLPLALLAMALSAGPYAHYYMPLYVPLAVGLGVVCSGLVSRITSPSGGWRRVGWFAILIAAWIWPGYHVIRTCTQPQRSLDTRYRTVEPAEASPAVADYLATHTEEGESILVIGSEPQIYYYADRPAASRMVFTYPMTGPYTFAPALRAAYLQALEESGPRYVLVVGWSRSISEYPALGRRFMDSTQQILAAHYDIDAQPDPGLVVYRRREARD